jgi:hypothetical protein
MIRLLKRRRRRVAVWWWHTLFMFRIRRQCWIIRNRQALQRLDIKRRMWICLWRVCWRCAQDSGDPLLWGLTLTPLLLALWPVLWLLWVAR